MSAEMPWWKGAVIYQIYPRSFMDSNGDGVGDLPGIIEKLDYVASLGVDAVWVSPFYQSPMKDFGYDISDYQDVHPIFGSLDDFKILIEKAHSLNLKVIVDQVLGHTSDQHPWFKESRQSRNNAKADWYVWSDPKEDGMPPNNWLSMFGGVAWVWNSEREQYYMHNFLECQPDLNFHNPEVRQAQLDNVKFWLDLGVDGVRLDVINFAFHSQGLEDNPADMETNTIQASPHMPYSYQKHIYDISQPENIDFLKELRVLLDQYPGSTSIGEISANKPLAIMAEYTSGGDKLHMAYTFSFLRRRSSSEHIRKVLRETEEKIGDGWPCWSLSNHDVTRSLTRWGGGGDPKAYPLVSLAMLLSVRGSMCIYQGEELGYPQADVPLEYVQDPLGIPYWPKYKGRDGCRTPMAWKNEINGGFTTGKPWLPLDDAHLQLAVDEQEGQAGSILNSVRSFVAWRSQQPALIHGSITVLDGDNDILCWLREHPKQVIMVAINLTGDTLRTKSVCCVKKVLEGHGFAGRLDGETIVLEPYQALFAEVVKE